MDKYLEEVSHKQELAVSKSHRDILHRGRVTLVEEKRGLVLKSISQ